MLLRMNEIHSQPKLSCHFLVQIPQPPSHLLVACCSLSIFRRNSSCPASDTFKAQDQVVAPCLASAAFTAAVHINCAKLSVFSSLWSSYLALTPLPSHLNDSCSVFSCFSYLLSRSLPRHLRDPFDSSCAGLSAQVRHVHCLQLRCLCATKVGKGDCVLTLLLLVWFGS